MNTNAINSAKITINHRTTSLNSPLINYLSTFNRSNFNRLILVIFSCACIVLPTSWFVCLPVCDHDN